MAVIDTGADAQPAKHASNSLFSRMSISGLIRSGFGLVTALVLVFSIGVYFAMSNVENTFRSMADLSEKREVVNEVFEDLFEARVAGFEYLSSGQQRSLDAVISNLDEIRAMMAQPPGRQSSELTSFEAGADLAAVLSPGLDAFQESLIEFSRLRQQMNSKLSGITSEILSASENIDQISAATVGAGMVSASTALLDLKKSLFVLMNAKAEFVQSGDEADLDRAIQAAVEVEAGLARVVGVLSGSQWVNGLSETTASLDKVNADLADVSRQNTALREFVASASRKSLLHFSGWWKTRSMASRNRRQARHRRHFCWSNALF